MYAADGSPSDVEELVRELAPCHCGGADLGHLVVPAERPSLLMLEHLAAARRLFPVDPARANEAQRAGLECVACARGFFTSGEPGMPVGNDLFACRSCVLAYACGRADAAYVRGPVRLLLRAVAVVLAGAAVRLRYWRS
jgi:hypothetical protein